MNQEPAARGTYRLARQTATSAAYGQVSLMVHAGQPGVYVADDAYAWSQHAGPDVMSQAAVRGVRHAMQGLEAARVTITEIRYLAVDSTPDAIAHAAARALWIALGVAPPRSELLFGHEVSD